MRSPGLRTDMGSFRKAGQEHECTVCSGSSGRLGPVHAGSCMAGGRQAHPDRGICRATRRSRRLVDTCAQACEHLDLIGAISRIHLGGLSMQSKRCLGIATLLAVTLLALGSISQQASAQRKFTFAYDQPRTTAYGIAADIFDSKLK